MNVVDAGLTPSPELCWFTSSYSSGAGGECVEVAAAPAVVRVRDSKDKAGPILSLTSDAWREFVGFVAKQM
ncbi:DUF397 domain-containing protein [Streptomyces sp. NPDC002133]|uniref:DUF397 domain-containing protein n=1 Tax=Streptomyces sp. NPDC002133 TaxID=3154409 RepID=UPI0033323A60